MAITEGEWASIGAMATKIAEKVSGGRRGFLTARVIKRDENNKLVWVRELGGQAIPVVGLDYNVKYYDTDSSGTVNVKKAVISPAVPKIGQNVFIILEMGEASLPRCLGTIQGRNWLESEDETGFGGDV